MPCDPSPQDKSFHFSAHKRTSPYLFILVLATGWLIFISCLHLGMNFDYRQRDLIRMGYMPVIANLACPLLDEATRDGNGIRFEALKFSSFAELGEALRNGHIEAAFIIAPLSIVLRQQGAEVRVVYIGNRHESTLVVRKDLDVKDFGGLAGKKIAVPMRYSGHNVATRGLAEQFRMNGAQLNIVEMNPPDMPSALATGALDAYFVGEPFAAQTIRSGHSKVLYYVEQIWPGFICNLLVVKQDFIDRHSDRVLALVQGAARSGYWASGHTKEAANIAARYWNQPEGLVEFALERPKNRIVFDRFVPKKEELQGLADQMVRFDLLKQNNISGLVEDRFALSANLEGISDFRSILNSK
jgi:NitT/TauT family transport system substrate-binding protein